MTEDRYVSHAGPCVDGPYAAKSYTGSAGQTMFELFQSPLLTLREFDDGTVPGDTLVPPNVKLGEYRWTRDDYGRGPGGSWCWHPENPS